MLVHESTDLAIGYAQLYPSFCSNVCAPILILGDLFVMEAARGQGFARHLLSAARMHARTTRVARIQVTTAADNKAAQALFESSGFEYQSGIDAYSLSSC